jgi:hypothetical protein
LHLKFDLWKVLELKRNRNKRKDKSSKEKKLGDYCSKLQFALN